jgi:hypothetical protein
MMKQSILLKALRLIIGIRICGQMDLYNVKETTHTSRRIIQEQLISEER